MEGVWDTTRGAPLLLFAIPDGRAAQEPLRDRDPQAGQLDPDAIELDGEIQGLNDFRDAHPPVLRGVLSPSA